VELRVVVMLHTFGWIFCGFMGVFMLANALFMLVSPRAWFRLPSWLRAQGSLVEAKYARGGGAIQVRLTGALLLGFIVWVLYEMFLKPR
jgi:hypothetical protein